MAASGGAEPDPDAAVVREREREEEGARPRRRSAQGTEQGREEECAVEERERGGPAR